MAYRAELVIASEFPPSADAVLVSNMFAAKNATNADQVVVVNACSKCTPKFWRPRNSHGRARTFEKGLQSQRVIINKQAPLFFSQRELWTCWESRVNTLPPGAQGSSAEVREEARSVHHRAEPRPSNLRPRRLLRT